MFFDTGKEEVSSFHWSSFVYFVCLFAVTITRRVNDLRIHCVLLIMGKRIFETIILE